MKRAATAIADVLILEPAPARDPRGEFTVTWNREEFAALGIRADFVQDACARSKKNVLRGLHYQVLEPQGKLVRVVAGEIFDVAVDLRRSSPTFGKWVGERLSAENRRILWIPAGFAHGYVVVSDGADVEYKIAGAYAPSHERSIRWDDPDLAIAWPIEGAPILSPRDAAAVPLAQAETYA